MAFLFGLAIIILLNIIYTIGFLAAQIMTKAHRQHYFLGFNPGLFTFRLRKIKFILGIYIPVFGLSRIYYINDNREKQICYPWQFTNASILQRLFVTYSGVLSLFVFGIMLAIIAVYTSEERYIPKEEVNRHGIYPSEKAREFGFQPGDQILALNGNDYQDFYELIKPEIVHSPETYYTILREGQQIGIFLHEIEPALAKREMFLSLNAPFSVGKVMSGSSAENAGILQGDKIVKVNGQTVVCYQELRSLFQSDEDNEVLLEINREENLSRRTFEKVVPLNLDKAIGIFIDEDIQYKTRAYSLLQSVSVGIKQFSTNLLNQVETIRGILGLSFSGRDEKLSGPIRTSLAFGEYNVNWWMSFIYLYIGYVIMLNFLPLPKSAMLEVIPLGYELLRRKPLTYESFRLLRKTGFVFLLLLMMWQFVRDALWILS